MAASHLVQIVDLDDNHVTHCTLDEFVDANPDTLDDDEEMRSLLAGDRVAVGGGAAPAFAVELQR